MTENGCESSIAIETGSHEHRCPATSIAPYTAVQNDRIVDDIALHFVRRLTWLVAYTTPTVTVAGTTHRRSA